MKQQKHIYDEKKQSIETDSEMTQRMELTGTDVKTAMITLINVAFCPTLATVVRRDAELSTHLQYMV